MKLKKFAVASHAVISILSYPTSAAVACVAEFFGIEPKKHLQPMPLTIPFGGRTTHKARRHDQGRLTDSIQVSGRLFLDLVTPPCGGYVHGAYQALARRLFT